MNHLGSTKSETFTAGEAPSLDRVGELVGLARIADLFREEAGIRDLEVLADPRVGDHLGDLVRRGDRQAPSELLDVGGEDVGDRPAVGCEVVIAEGVGLIALVGEDQLPGELRLLVTGAPDERDRPRPPFADVIRRRRRTPESSASPAHP